MQSLSFGILGISNNHPRQLANPPKQGQAGQSQLLQAIPVTNPTNRASRCRREGTCEGGEGSKATTSTKKAREPFTGDSTHLLIMPTNWTYISNGGFLHHLDRSGQNWMVPDSPRQNQIPFSVVKIVRKIISSSLHPTFF